MGCHVYFFGRRCKILPHEWVKPFHQFVSHAGYHGIRTRKVTGEDEAKAKILAKKINESLGRRVKSFLAGMFTRKDFARSRRG